MQVPATIWSQASAAPANNLLPLLAAAGTGALNVTSLADSNIPGLTSLRQAPSAAATLGGSQTITFAAGLTGTITLGSPLVIGSNVTIDGPVHHRSRSPVAGRHRILVSSPSTPA